MHWALISCFYAHHGISFSEQPFKTKMGRVSPILQIREEKLREVKELAQDPTVGRMLSWDAELAHPTRASHALPVTQSGAPSLGCRRVPLYPVGY